MNGIPLVLVIEDEKSIRDLVARALSLNNYRVISAKNGSEGMSMATDCKPDIILLDLGLPDIGGAEVLKHIRQRSNTPVIVDTANVGGDEKRSVLALGADDFIEKPFTVSVLLERVKNVICRSPKLIGGSFA